MASGAPGDAARCNPCLSLLEIIHNTCTHAARDYLLTNIDREEEEEEGGKEREEGRDLMECRGSLFSRLFREIFMPNEAHCGPPSDLKAIVSATKIREPWKNAPNPVYLMQIFQRPRKN